MPKVARSAAGRVEASLLSSDARVDPQPPPGSPLNLHDVGETSALAERRIENAKTEPVESHQSRLRDDEG